MIPFTFHWKEGVVPPLTGVAVNTTDELAQIVSSDTVMEMLTGLPGVMIISIEDDAPAAQVSVPNTETFPFTAEGPKFTVIEFVLKPETIVQPEGTLQTYPVA